MSNLIGINEARIAPVTEDLTTPFSNLEILRGFERANRVDRKVAAGVNFKAGEYGVLGNDGLLHRPSTTPNVASYLIFAGTDRFDAKATGQATTFEASAMVIKTDLYDTGASYTVGDLLASKDRGAGEADVTKATSGQWAIGKVTEVGSGYLVYELFSQTMKA